MIEDSNFLTPKKRFKKGELRPGRPANMMRKVNPYKAARRHHTDEYYLHLSNNYLRHDYPDTENA